MTEIVRDNMAKAIKRCRSDKRITEIEADAFKIALRAYNRFQEDNRDGVDYIFNIYENEDLIAMLQGGINCETIAKMVSSGFCFFHYGANYPTTPTPLSSDDAYFEIYRNCDELVKQVVIYQSYYYEYADFFNKFFSENMIY